MRGPPAASWETEPRFIVMSRCAFSGDQRLDTRRTYAGFPLNSPRLCNFIREMRAIAYLATFVSTEMTTGPDLSRAASGPVFELKIPFPQGSPGSSPGPGIRRCSNELRVRHRPHLLMRLNRDCVPGSHGAGDRACAILPRRLATLGTPNAIQYLQITARLGLTLIVSAETHGNTHTS